jgi:hypothetical protein
VQPPVATDAERAAFLDAIEESLRPLMRVVFAYGVSYQELVEVVRGLYVYALRDRLESEERPVTPARLGIMTGTTRGEILSLFETRELRAEQRELATRRIDLLSLLLTRWHDDPQFSTPYGAPLDLSLKPEGSFRTFDQLVAASGIEMDRDSIIEQLRQIGCLEIHGEQFVRCVRRTLISPSADVARIAHLGSSVAALSSTLVHNLLNDEKKEPYFERYALSDFPLSPRGKSLLLAQLREEGGEFISQLDRWISGKAEEVADSSGVRCGVSMFFFESRNSGEPNQELGETRLGTIQNS